MKTPPSPGLKLSRSPRGASLTALIGHSFGGAASLAIAGQHAIKEEQQLEVTGAVASEDGRSVTLTIPELREGFVVHIRTDPVSVQGEAIWSGDVWYTLNRIPE